VARLSSCTHACCMPQANTTTLRERTRRPLNICPLGTCPGLPYLDAYLPTCLLHAATYLTPPSCQCYTSKLSNCQCTMMVIYGLDYVTHACDRCYALQAAMLPRADLLSNALTLNPACHHVFPSSRHGSFLQSECTNPKGPCLHTPAHLHACIQHPLPHKQFIELCAAATLSTQHPAHSPSTLRPVPSSLKPHASPWSFTCSL